MPAVKEGQIDVTNYNHALGLSGKWAFAAMQFVSPKASLSSFERFESFPASWDSYEDRLSPKGYATYAVKIVGLDPKIDYALWFPGLSSAATCYIDGEVFYSQGKPSGNKEDEQAYKASSLVSLPKQDKTELFLLIHLSNFFDIHSGASHPIRFGPLLEVSRLRNRIRTLLTISFAALIIVSVLFIVLFFFKTSDKTPLWLGLLSLLLALRITCYDEYFFLMLFPSAGFELMFRLGYFTLAIALAEFTIFFFSLYPFLSKKIITDFISGSSIVYSLLTLFGPVSFFTKLLIPFQIILLLTALWLISLAIKAIRLKLNGSLILTFGFLFFISTLVHDILVSNRIINGIFMVQFGITGIIYAIGLMIIKNISIAFNKQEKLNDNLNQLNKTLELFVPVRFLKYLGKTDISKVLLGDNSQQQMSIVFLNLKILNNGKEIDDQMQLFNAFNKVIETISPVVISNEGIIDKFFAGGIMLLFPAEKRSAMHCILEIIKTIKNTKFYNNDALLKISASAGMHTGNVVLGTLGDAERMDTTVVSDAVNIASRITELADKKNDCLLASNAFLKSNGYQKSVNTKITPFGRFSLRGRSATVDIYEISSI